MTRKFRDNLHLCFSQLRRSPSKSPHPSLLPTKAIPFSTSPHSSSSPSALVKNYNSLYDPASDSSENGAFSKTFTPSSGATSSPDSDDPEPDLASAYASRRFFFSYPGHSNSIIDDQPPPHPPASVAVPKISPDPFMDFRRSMEEMIVSRGLDVRQDWDDLQELLLCYLSLNRKQTHKFILGAFADLLASLTVAEDARDGRRRRRGG
ncbi:transcription repressor OFP12 [Aristolochia californica]|uniref:transcription repressor OFP12 n=1 Tax=Aristolochia californica TaxID=171875 RepID=UPI0035D746A9